MLTRALILLAGLLSLLAGSIYHSDVMLSFNFLGVEVGSERETVWFWGKCSIILGLTLLVSLWLRPKMKESVNDAMLVAVLALLFVIQIPPLCLWPLFMLIDGVASTWLGLLIHGAIAISICLSFVSARRGLARAAS